jgi:ribosomal protein S18 acetylase RimI-like enzyme
VPTATGSTRARAGARAAGSGSLGSGASMAASRSGSPATASPCTGPGCMWPRSATCGCAGRGRCRRCHPASPSSASRTAASTPRSWSVATRTRCRRWRVPPGSTSAWPGPRVPPRPHVVWAIPNQEQRQRILPDFFSLYAEVFLRQDLTYTTREEVRGAALWALSGRVPVSGEDAEDFGRRMEQMMTGVDAPRFLEIGKLIDDHHPPGSYYYLQFLGVAPDRQSQGIGAALMAPVLERCDRQGVLAYLDATNEGSKQLYERHGFQAAQHSLLPGATPVADVASASFGSLNGAIAALTGRPDRPSLPTRRLPRSGGPRQPGRRRPGSGLAQRSSWSQHWQAPQRSSSPAVPPACHSQRLRPVPSAHPPTRPRRPWPASFVT